MTTIITRLFADAAAAKAAVDDLLSRDHDPRTINVISGAAADSATVDQLDGYRFLYSLPFSPTRLLIEDTYYSDNRALDVPRLAERIDAYAAARGWTIAAVERQEALGLDVLVHGEAERGVVGVGDLLLHDRLVAEVAAPAAVFFGDVEAQQSFCWP